MSEQAFTMKLETKAFNRHVRDFLKKSNISVEKGLKKFAFDLLTRIIKKNPVDTGRSRAAWYIAMEKLGGSIGVSMPSDTPRKSGKSRTYPAGVAEGRSKGRFIDHTKGFLDKYIEIINGISYIIYLEYGYSGQAPFGMVRLSMRELRRGKLPQEMSEQLQKDWNSFYR